MNANTVAIILKLLPFVFQLFPKLVELVKFAREAPEGMTEEEIVARWIETTALVNDANSKWESK